MYYHDEEFLSLKYLIDGLLKEISQLKSEVQNLQRNQIFKEGEIMTSKEVRTMLRISEKTLINLENKGIVPFVQYCPKGVKRYKRRDIIEILNS